ncbi:MAG: hypothetical protein ACJ73S_13445 [Mycobacteriales bacterium]
MSVPLALTVLAGSLTGSAAPGVAAAGPAAATVTPGATVLHGPTGTSPSGPASTWSPGGGGIPLPLPGGVGVRLPLVGDLPIRSSSPGPHPPEPPDRRQPATGSRSAGAGAPARPVTGETAAPHAATPAAGTATTGSADGLPGIWTTVLSLVAGLAAVFAFLGVLSWLGALPGDRTRRNRNPRSWDSRS